MVSFVGSSCFKEIVSHILRVYGLPTRSFDVNRLQFSYSPNKNDAAFAVNMANPGGVFIAFNPALDFVDFFGVQKGMVEGDQPLSLRTCRPIGSRVRQLRTLYEANSFTRPDSEAVVVDQTGKAVWLSVPVGKGHVLFVGSDLVNDIMRFRQGNPVQAEKGQSGDLWGFSNERPNYLFEGQLKGLPKGDRQADYWALLLASYIAGKLGFALHPILPDGAPGAIVITGDDDQAYLEKYSEQLSIIGDTPITYFLHPLTRHTPETLKTILGKKSIDLGIHPDAIDEPKRYASLLKEQCAWFKKLVGSVAISVRNHGFLNDGYWGHLTSWLNEGVRISSNLPGLDGRVLNGSLLPARVVFEDSLTPHWSILTAIGDGVRFISGMTDEDAGKCVTNLASEIRTDGIPGVIVINLHPQNVGETKAMHLAALEVINSGFIAWSVRDCLNWFESVDKHSEGDKNFKHHINRMFKKLKDIAS